VSKAYDRYLARRAVWLACLNGDDVHSVWPQIWRATWNVAVYRVVMRAIELAPSAPDGGHELSGTVFNLFRDTVFDAECLRVRRLTEVEPHGLDRGDRSVYSLGTLLKDMEDHAHLLTMKNIMQAEVDRDSAKWWQDERRQDTERLLRYGGTPQAHVPKSLFEDMRTRLSTKAAKVAAYADKYIAHSASPLSRASAETAGPSFAEILDAQKTIVEAADVLSVYILDGGSHGKIPTAVHDQFAYLDRGLAPDDETVARLRERWNESQAEVSGWTTNLSAALEQLQADQQA